MKTLEQILQEIDEIHVGDTGLGVECNIGNKTGLSCNNCYECIKNVCCQIIRSHMEDDGWIPAECPPKTDTYILLSFSNFSLPMVGRYEADGDGGAFYLGDCYGEDTCTSNDLYVNAWQPLPEPYRPKDEDNQNEIQEGNL